MEARGVVSDKQQLITVLENTYKVASSEKDFYKKLQQQNIKLYSRNNTIVGAKLNRRFHFKTLGFDKSVLQELDKSITQNKRLRMLKSIREEQQIQSQEKSKGRERSRN